MGKKLSEMSTDELREAICSLVKENEDLRKKAGLCSNEEATRNLMCDIMCNCETCKGKECKWYPKEEKDSVPVSYKEYIDFAHLIEKAESQFVGVYTKLWKDKEGKYEITGYNKYLSKLQTKLHDLYTLVNEVDYDLLLIGQGKLDRIAFQPIVVIQALTQVRLVFIADRR